MVLDSLSIDSVAQMARGCAAFGQARRLAEWVGDGRRVTPKHVLRPVDVPAAAQALGITVPERVRTAADVPGLHRPWSVALAIDLLRIVDGNAVAGPMLEEWPHIDDEAACELWLAGLMAAFAPKSDDADEIAAATLSLVVLAVVAADPPELADLARKVHNVLRSDYSSGDVFYSVYSMHGDPIAAAVDLLIEFGAVTREGSRVEVTPLGRWALHEIRERQPKPISPDLSATELIVRLTEFDGDDAWHAARPWLANRTPLQAARDLLEAAADATPAQRIAAIEIVDGLGEPAMAVWREVAAVPNLAAHARDVLAEGDLSALSAEDLLWLTVEYAAAALAEHGPDEALSCVDERVDGEDLDTRIRAVSGSGHPDAAALAEALTAFVTSGAQRTSSQVYQLKISLKRMRPPVWRRVLVPATARLGLLHDVIQIVMDWDGDHLHAFTVGRERYGDPSYDLELDDEDRLRLSGAFTPSTKTITYLYDFGAHWDHEVTLEKVLDVEPGTTYPVCVTGKGDFPIEYWSEDEDDDQVSVPFDKDMINRRLAGLARRSDPA